MESGERREVRWFEIVMVLLVIAAAVMFWIRPQHKVGVIDVMRISKEVKVLNRINDELKVVRDKAANKAVRLQQEQNERIEGLKKKLKAAATEAERDKIQGEIDSAKETFEQTILGMRQDIQRTQSQMVATFHKRLQPYIKQIARKRNMDLVVDSNVGIAYCDFSAVDITDAVIEICRSGFPLTQPLIDESSVSSSRSDRADEPLAAPVSTKAPAKSR